MATAIDVSQVSDATLAPAIPMDTFAKILATVQHAASKDETRYHLNSVYLEHADNVLRATTTDGHRLAQASTEVPTESVFFPDGSALLAAHEIPRILAECKRLAKLHGKALAGFLRVSLAVVNGALEVAWNLEGADESNQTTFRFELVDGEFPNYRQVLPPDREPAAAFNGGYLADAMKALGALNPKSQPVRVKPADAVSPWRFDCKTPEGIDARVIVMPMRL